MKRGIVSLSILLMLCVLLTLAFLYQEQNLSFLRQQNALRKNYAVDFWHLRKLIEDSPLCENIDAPQLEQRFRQRWTMDKEDGLQQSIFCEREQGALFSAAISKKLYERKIESFVNIAEMQTRTDWLMAPEQLIATAKPQIYWLPKNKSYLTLQGKVHGIIFAEGALTLAGVGEFRGAIITGGKFELKGKAKLTYDLKTIKALTGKGWKPAAHTWIDYEAD